MLEVNNLTIEYRTGRGALRAAEDVDMRLDSGEIHGLVGESGSGKTTVARGIMGNLPENAQIVSGEVYYNGQELTGLSESELKSTIRWTDIAWIAQNAMSALDPVWKVGGLMTEAIQQHEDATKAEAREKAGDLLERVGLERNTLNDYSHELSGGQRQRVSIALALTNDPAIVIADEPTTGLDVMIQEGVLQLLQEIQDDLNLSVLLITHNMAAVGAIADSVSVMYGGQIVEQGTATDVLNNPYHPYTIGLQSAFPTVEESKQLITIPGTPPDLVDAPTGCRFKNRCPFATAECGSQDIPFQVVEDEDTPHYSRCIYPEDAEQFRTEGTNAETWIETPGDAGQTMGDVS